MKISKRLKTIADLIPDNSRVIDVGCDHAYLSIYLSREKNCRCIASDVNENALENAKNNKRKYNSDIEIVLTDGLNGIDISNDDYIIIAGMGTTTICNILKDKKLSNNIIISSNNQLYELRKFVVELGYYISEEIFVEDYGKKYVIIKFIKGIKKYSKKELEYGPIVSKDINYLSYELTKLLSISSNIDNSNFLTKLKYKKKIKNIKKLIQNEQGK